jgi:ubiquinone/menaquinone biosynthesis C-methylase UbiE
LTSYPKETKIHYTFVLPEHWRLLNYEKRGQKPMPEAMFKLLSITAEAFCRFMDLGKQLKKSGVCEGQTILDFGCGSGHFSIAAARIVGEKGRVYALDIHPLAIRAVEKRVAKNDISNVSSILSSGKTGLPEESVDIVLLYRTFYQVKDKQGLLDELYRVMKPGGIISVLSGGIPDCLKTVEKDSRFPITERGGRLVNIIKK